MKLRILVSSAGRRVELMRCFRADARAIGVDLEILACDLDPQRSAACHEADLALRVPACAEEAFIPALLDLCEAHRIDLVVPTIDTELEPLSRSREAFRAMGTEVAVSSHETVRVARDKLRTALFLREHGLPTPRTARADEVLASAGSWSWPVIVKPRGGSSSLGVRTVEAPSSLASLERPEAYVVQERLVGEEFTVNMFVDRGAAVRAVVPHLRWEVRAGEVSKGVTRRQPELERIGRALGRALDGARGALCFQAMVDGQGRASVFELNARFGGGYPLAHRAGAPFTRWLLEEVAGRQPSYGNEWREGLVMLRYDCAFFIEEGSGRLMC